MQANQQQQLDAVDKKLLNEIQWVFPLVDRPYLEIAKRYDISEEDVMRRIAFMKNKGALVSKSPFLTQGDLDTRAPLLPLQLDLTNLTM